MKNYKYNIGKEEIVLTQEEHKEILQAFKDKRSHVILRNGNLGIRIDLIGKFEETDLATKEQIKKREDFLAIPPQDRNKSGFLPRSEIRGGGFTKAVSNDMKACERCKKVHFIPEEKKYCLPCLGKIIREEKGKKYETDSV